MSAEDDVPVLPPHIRSFLEEKFGKDHVLGVSVHPAKSAQQSVLILQFPETTTTHCCDCDTTTSTWHDYLIRGNHRLVVRIWKGSSRWWNLNQASSVSTTTVQEIATKEIWGYRCAAHALPSVRIPRVIHFECNRARSASSSKGGGVDDDDGAVHHYPWALLEYVGPHSTIFSDRGTNDTIVVVPDNGWTRTMIQVRDEFGFSEPHPRWGRVPVHSSLQYATTVLHSVIVPLHRFYFAVGCPSSSSEQPTIASSAHSRSSSRGVRYRDMVSFYRQTVDRIWKEGVYPNDDKKDDPVLRTAWEKLEQAILALEQQQDRVTAVSNPLPPVLCHLDLQPQNLLFARNTSKRQDKSTVCYETNAGAFIVSVLDWEEAEYADPRFELLLLGRKVCANKEQAIQIWQLYQESMNVAIGPMEPWLALETVHSLTCLLLQASSSTGSGRSPWETKSELWGKIEREFNRL